MWPPQLHTLRVHSAPQVASNWPVGEKQSPVTLKKAEENHQKRTKERSRSAIVKVQVYAHSGSTRPKPWGSNHALRSQPSFEGAAGDSPLPCEGPE